MAMKDLLKNWRIWILLLSIGVSAFFLGPQYETGENGQTQIATNLNQGLELRGGTRVLLDVQGEDLNRTQVEQVSSILQTRVSAFGLTQTDIRTVRLAGDEFRIQISVADTNRSRLRDLVSQEGSFEARMPLRVANTEEFTLENTYTFEKVDGGVSVNGTVYNVNDTFELDGTRFYYHNESEGEATLEAVMYTGEDVESVIRSGQGVGVSRNQGGSFNFQFPVVITQESAENVRSVAENYETVILRGQGYLGQDGQASQLRLYVDGQLQSSLNMAAAFKTQTIVQPSITGSESSAEAARQEMRRLQSVLESGRLPYPVQIDTISTITSSLGQEFLSTAFISIVASLIAVGVLVFIRYGDPKVAVPIVITGSSEVFILMGSWFSTFATLNLASIAGIIAAVGTGVDDQIIITDESGRERIRSWKKRMKRAFFVIFTSAASTIGAMMPIVSPEISTLSVMLAGIGLIGYTLQGSRNPHYIAIGGLAAAVGAASWFLSPSGFALQAVRGFAVTTILGIMVGITITRPAYAEMLEELRD